MKPGKPCPLLQEGSDRVRAASKVPAQSFGKNVTGNNNLKIKTLYRKAQEDTTKTEQHPAYPASSQLPKLQEHILKKDFATKANNTVLVSLPKMLPCP